MGIWKGFVGIDEDHPFWNKHIDELLKLPEAIDIFLSVYGGLSAAGRLPAKYKELAKNLWWISIETTHGGDLMPLLKLEVDVAKIASNQTYKDLHFICRETNKLASLLAKVEHVSDDVPNS